MRGYLYEPEYKEEELPIKGDGDNGDNVPERTTAI